MDMLFSSFQNRSPFQNRWSCRRDVTEGDERTYNIILYEYQSEDQRYNLSKEYK